MSNMNHTNDSAALAELNAAFDCYEDALFWNSPP